MTMDPQPFIFAAYAVTLIGVLGYLAASLRRMRTAERLAGDDGAGGPLKPDSGLKPNSTGEVR